MDNNTPATDQKTKLSPFNIFIIGVALILLGGLFGGVIDEAINWPNGLFIGKPTFWTALGLILLGSWVLFFIDGNLGWLVFLIEGLVYAISVWVSYGLSVWLQFVAMGIGILLTFAITNRIVARF